MLLLPRQGFADVLQVVGTRRIALHLISSHLISSPPERSHSRIVEQIVLLPVPQFAEDVVEVDQITSQDRISERHVEQSADVAVPQMFVEIVEEMAQIVDAPAPQIEQEVIDLLMIFFVKKNAGPPPFVVMAGMGRCLFFQSTRPVWHDCEPLMHVFELDLLSRLS